MEPASIAPQFDKTGKLNKNSFSRDNAFLVGTSHDLFGRGDGGLADTQVAWLDTKSMPLDQRPLSLTLREDELVELERQYTARTGLASLPQGFRTMPRMELIRAVNLQQGRTMNNLNIIDLGELRGTHWDIAFRNVYKSGRNHLFPRKAMLTALVETLAVYSSALRGQ